jgi:hypothetical protein
MEWNEGMPLAVRRYDIDQKKCKFLFKVCKCTGKPVDRTAMMTGMKERGRK